MKHSFFYRLYVFDKTLFLLVIIFSGFTIFCNIKGVEITPFFVWAMYSEKEDTTNKYEVFRIEVNDSILVDYSSGFTDNNRFFLHSPLGYFNRIRQNNFIDPTRSFLQSKLGPRYSALQPFAEKVLNQRLNHKQFTSWYKRYLAQTLNMPIRSYKVYGLLGHYTAGQQVHIDSSYLVAAWPQQ